MKAIPGGKNNIVRKPEDYAVSKTFGHSVSGQLTH